MRILVIGAAGMIGRKLTASLIARGEIGGKKIDKLILADIVVPETPAFAGSVETVACDLSAPDQRDKAVGIPARLDFPSRGNRFR